MNHEFCKDALQRIKNVTRDEMCMIGITMGFSLQTRISVSRNKREGHYAGRFMGKHIRDSKCRTKKRKEYIEEYC